MDVVKILLEYGADSAIWALHLSWRWFNYFRIIDKANESHCCKLESKAQSDARQKLTKKKLHYRIGDSQGFIRARYLSVQNRENSEIFTQLDKAVEN